VDAISDQWQSTDQLRTSLLAVACGDEAPALVQAGNDAQILKSVRKDDRFCYGFWTNGGGPDGVIPHELRRFRNDLTRPRVHRAKLAMISSSLVAASSLLGIVQGHSCVFSHRTVKTIEVCAIFFVVAMMILRRAQRSR
jgi:hypothetical protein